MLFPRNHNRDMARSLPDRVAPAHSSWFHALHNRSLIGKGCRDHKLVDIQMSAFLLGISHSRLQHLFDQTRTPVGHIPEINYRGGRILAPDEIHYPSRLPWRNTCVFKYCLGFHVYYPFDADFSDPEWPLKVLVGENSPNL